MVFFYGNPSKFINLVSKAKDQKRILKTEKKKKEESTNLIQVIFKRLIADFSVEIREARRQCEDKFKVLTGKTVIQKKLSSKNSIPSKRILQKVFHGKGWKN